MKSKRRTSNVDPSMCNKKIITRNMKNKILNDKKSVLSINNNEVSEGKSSLNTRAKNNTLPKADSDPYSFSKMDEECKIPIKKLKMIEKNDKEVTVNTCNTTTMTEPELLGPCEPGTSISLQGIVWLETDTGLLVINVTWKGRTYVGTLLDSSKYQMIPPLNSQDCLVKIESGLNGRISRSKQRYIQPTTNYHCSLRSHTNRHSRHGLVDSFVQSEQRTKFSSRLAQSINSCYIDSLSMSADASNSCESDTESNNYRSFTSNNKNRSVTRSLAKQRKSIIDDINESNLTELDGLSNLLNCSQSNCFKKFTNNTALKYHRERCHGVFDEIDAGENIVNSRNDCSSKVENTGDGEKLFTTDGVVNETINNKIKIEESLSESDQKFSENSLVIDSLDFIKVDDEDVAADCVDNVSGLQTEISINLPQNVTNCNYLSVSGKELKSDSQEESDFSDSKIIDQVPISNQSNHVIRTVTAPTVSIPFEPNAPESVGNLVMNLNLSQTIIKPKLTIPPSSSVIPISPTCKSKKLLPNYVNPNFQIPSTNIMSKKRPLVPLKVAGNQNLGTNSNCASVTTSIASRDIRKSTFSTVTPILPATLVTNTLTPTISNSGLSNSFLSVCSSTKRIGPMSTTSVSPPVTNTLFSLKPIQPKPKISNTPSTHSQPTSIANVTTVSSTPLPGMMPNQTSHQRQILPSPISKLDNSNYQEERFFPKTDIAKSTAVKKKRKKPENKLRINNHDCNRIKKSTLNSIQPKPNRDYQRFFTGCLENYKMDEENSHSPGYSDLSETNDTPAPILEKEIELKSMDCDKLVICTDYECTDNSKRIEISSLDSYDDIKDGAIYNKPPALMPAVLSTDLLNGSTNEVDMSDSLTKPGRRIKKPATSITVIKEPPKGYDKEICVRQKVTNPSNRRSFQTLSRDEQTSSTSLSTSTSPSLYNTSFTESPESDQNSKIKFPIKVSNLSAINDYVWMTKNNQELKLKSVPKPEDDGKCHSLKAAVQSQIQKSNGRFSVQALTSPQDIVSRSFTTSSSVISANPSTKLANSLFKN